MRLQNRRGIGHAFRLKPKQEIQTCFVDRVGNRQQVAGRMRGRIDPPIADVLPPVRPAVGIQFVLVRRTVPARIDPIRIERHLIDRHSTAGRRPSFAASCFRRPTRPPECGGMTLPWESRGTLLSSINRWTSVLNSRRVWSVRTKTVIDGWRIDSPGRSRKFVRSMPISTSTACPVFANRAFHDPVQPTANR